MFAQSAALPAPARTMPVPMLVSGYAHDAGAGKAPADRPNISPYLQRPLRRIEEVEKARDKKVDKQSEKDADVTERR